MQLKREIYHFGGKDYEAEDTIEFTFYVDRASINNFLNIKYSDHKYLTVRSCTKSFGEAIPAYYVNGGMMPVTLKCIAWVVYNILLKLGVKYWSDVNKCEYWVRDEKLRNERKKVN